MNLDHTNALLFVPFTRSRGGGVEAEKILIYNSSSTITGRLSLKCLTIQYFSTKKKKNYNKNFLMIVGSLETFSPSGLLFSPKMYFLLLLFLMFDTSNLLCYLDLVNIFYFCVS